ncbi:MAG: ABC transporter ATP-binding protein [Geminicoccaceae bacterium]
MSQGEPALQLEGLRKTYRATARTPRKEALKGIDLTVAQGSFFGLLGPNGAGKSTLINILAGLVNKTEGQARICGIDIDANPRRSRLAIGVVPQELNMDPFFTPRETLDIQAGLYGVPKHRRKTMEILQAVGLADKAEAYARTLSGGMRRRLLVAKALVHSPQVIILDEPTAGVDVELRRSLWAYMHELNARGVTVVLTTHYLEEAEALCDHIAIINHGELVACDRKEHLIARLDEKCLTIVLADALDALPARLAEAGFTLAAPDRLRVAYQPSKAKVGSLLEAVSAENLIIRDIVTEEGDLEDLFVRLTSASSQAA